jgi:adenine-specific DNA-methyltransferase
MPILHWLNREQSLKEASRVPYRLLEADPTLSYGDVNTENMLIQGDNLEALKALLPYYAGKVKCIFIDPPYNTKSAFEHYDDNLEHTKWLEMMYPRLELLRELLAEDGFFCCHIDDSEGAYLKIILDEVFGRSNYETTFFVQVRYLDKTLKQDMAYHKQIEQIHIYKKSNLAKPFKPQESGDFKKFIFQIKTNKEATKTLVLGGKKVEVFSKGTYTIVKEKEGNVNGLKEIWATGSILDGNSSGRFFRDYLHGRVEEDGLGSIYRVHGIGDDQFDFRYFTGPQKISATKGKYYQGVPLDKMDGSIKELPIHNFYDFADRFGNCRHEGDVDFRSGKKPEHFLQLILSRFSQKKDLVLDSFLGSGSTAAVAHKMGRRYIGIELREQAITHCLPRLKKVIDGEKSGISTDENWQGGGGVRFYRLGQPIFDEVGQITAHIAFKHLAAHIWFSETRTPWQPQNSTPQTPLLGVHNGVAYYLLYNGILGDKRPQGGNVLTSKILATLPPHAGAKVIYGETSRLGAGRLAENNITFKQTPYDVKAR